MLWGKCKTHLKSILEKGCTDLFQIKKQKAKTELGNSIKILKVYVEYTAVKIWTASFHSFSVTGLNKEQLVVGALAMVHRTQNCKQFSSVANLHGTSVCV